MTENIRSNEKLAAKTLARIPLGRWAVPDEIAPALRLPGLRRRVLHHRTGTAGRRRDGHLMGHAVTDRSPRPAARSDRRGRRARPIGKSHPSAGGTATSTPTRCSAACYTELIDAQPGSRPAGSRIW